MAIPDPSPLARHWALDPDLVYLNHGSFGACPIAVLEAQRGHRDRMERDAVRFFCVDLWPLLDHARDAVGGLIGASPRDVVFVPNATTAVATVIEFVARGGLGGLLEPGDELLTTTHDYPACRFNLRRVAARSGAAVVEAPFPTPATHRAPITADDIVEAVLARVSPRTRLAMLSQITSPSGVVMPIARLCRELDGMGVPVLLDGAHGPGAVAFDLPSIAPAFYTANCHKWLCAPKGAAILWVRPDLQPAFRPLVLSNFAESPGAYGRGRFALEFDYVGTDDYTPAISIADAIGIIPGFAGRGWAGIAAGNRELVLRGRETLCARLGLDPPYAEDLIGPMATLELPRVPEANRARLASRPTLFSDALQDALLDRHRIQVPVWRSGDQLGGGVFDGRRSIRLSAQLYNSPAQYEYLAGALETELDDESRGPGR